jgi:spore coat polysaccharide biosynthesis predicted glycosyltransferase SpsG
MKILHGVQGTGNGHISRSRKMAAHLRARGAEVTYRSPAANPSACSIWNVSAPSNTAAA